MNKRILKLFNEAGFHQPEMERLGIDDKFEKFAELIVRECAKVLTQHGAYFSGDGEPYHYAASLIEEHFGVAE